MTKNILTIISVIKPLRALGTENSNSEIETYIDDQSNFKIDIYPGWRVVSKISAPEKATFSLNPKSVIYKQQEILFAASNFLEGATLTVIKTDARNLLKNADIDWWFGPLNELKELGTPELVGELLAIQREEQLEDSNPYQISSDVKKIRFNDYNNEEMKGYELKKAEFDNINQIMYFSYTTSVAKYVADVTYAKGYYKNGKLYVAFIKALGSVFDGEYGKILIDICGSFSLV